MSSKAILIRTGGLAAAALAHAVFASALLAGQPEPGNYLARLAPRSLPAPEVQMATRQSQRRAASGEIPAANTIHSIQLIRGLSTC